MRVLVYIPAGVRGAERQRRAREREIRERGDEYVGVVRSIAAAKAAREAGLADGIGGLPEHLVDLAEGTVVLGSVPRQRRPYAGVLLAPVAWLFGGAREHPAWAGAAAATAGAVAGLVALPLLLGPEPDRGVRVEPPAAGPPAVTASPTPDSSSPVPSPTATRHADPPDAPGPEPPGPGTGGELDPTPTPGETPEPGLVLPSLPESTPSPPAPTLPPPTTPPPTTSPPAAPEPEPEPCILRLELLGLTVRLCPDWPSSLQ